MPYWPGGGHEGLAWLAMSSFDGARVEELLAGDAYSTLLGIELVSVTADAIVLGLDVSPHHANFLGLGHGGLVFSLADCGMAVASNAGGDRAVAIDTHLVLTAASRPGDRLESTVSEVSHGRSLGTYRAEVTRQDGRTVGLFTGTVHVTAG